MKTAISLPDSVFHEAEALARQLGLSRSELYTNAIRADLDKYKNDQILQRLNQVYAEESSAPDPIMAGIQFLSLPSEDW
jgi:metal-responsive CopG/Arc/MetJ family transcriptional regulator